MTEIKITDNFKANVEGFFLILDQIQLGLYHIEEKMLQIDDMFYKIFDEHDEYGWLNMPVKEEYYHLIFDFDRGLFFGLHEIEVAMEFVDEHHSTLVKINPTFNELYDTLLELHDVGIHPVELLIRQSKSTDMDSAEVQRYHRLKTYFDRISVDLLVSIQEKVSAYSNLEHEVEDIVGEFERDYNDGWKPRIY